MNEQQIKECQNIFSFIVPEEFKRKYLDLSAHPITRGYNIYNSFRAGGKTTNEIIFCLIAKYNFNVRTAYLRTNGKATTEKMVFTLCQQLNSYVFDDGRNYVQTITNDEYIGVLYHNRTKTFRLLKSQEEDLKTAEVFMYVFDVEQSTDVKSGFNDTSCDIIIYDEFIDTHATSDTCIKYLNFISTIFRLRYNSIAFMNCNMSIGNPVLLRQFGIYEKVLNQTTEYMVYRNKKGTKVNVTLMQPPEDADNIDRLKMNETYFFFDNRIEGIENITGMSLCQQLYRTLPKDNYDLRDTRLYIHSCGNIYRVQRCTIDGWQPMYYVSPLNGILDHNASNVMITDDVITAFETPYTYASIGKDIPLAVDFAKAVRRNDVCYSDYMTYISIVSFYDYYKVSELI